jgi:hypothetical protein
VSCPVLPCPVALCVSVDIYRDGQLESAKYEGEWTIMCQKQHVHNKGCKPCVATGFGRMTRKVDGKQFIEEGWFHNFQLTTGSDSDPVDSDSDLPEDEQEAEDEVESEEESSDDTPSDEEVKESSSMGDESSAGDQASTVPAAAASSQPTSKKRPRSPESVASAADDEVAAPVKKKSKQTKATPAAADERESADSNDESPSACVLFRHEPKASSSMSRIVSETEANAFEVIAQKAAEARQRQGKPLHKTWASDGWTYRGSMKDGQRHGYGLTTFDSGSVFKGMYQNDRCTGESRHAMLLCISICSIRRLMSLQRFDVLHHSQAPASGLIGSIISRCVMKAVG